MNDAELTDLVATVADRLCGKNEHSLPTVGIERIYYFPPLCCKQTLWRMPDNHIPTVPGVAGGLDFQRWARIIVGMVVTRTVQQAPPPRVDAAICPPIETSQSRRLVLRL